MAHLSESWGLLGWCGSQHILGHVHESLMMNAFLIRLLVSCVQGQVNTEYHIAVWNRFCLSGTLLLLEAFSQAVLFSLEPSVHPLR